MLIATHTRPFSRKRVTGHPLLFHGRLMSRRICIQTLLSWTLHYFVEEERKRTCTHEMRVPGGERDRVRGSGLATVKIYLTPSRSARRAASGCLDQLHLDSFRREFHLRTQSTHHCDGKIANHWVIHLETKSGLHPISS